MDSTIVFWVFLGAVIIVAFTINALIERNNYIIQRDYIKAEMSRSHSKEEYEYWKKRLMLLRLGQIPVIGFFINK